MKKMHLEAVSRSIYKRRLVSYRIASSILGQTGEGFIREVMNSPVNDFIISRNT